MITQQQAKRGIIGEWEDWIGETSTPTGDTMFAFYVWLQQNRLDLLNFRYRGSDKWQRVHGWLLQHEGPR